MHVGTRIKTARQGLGLSQSDLAMMADVSQPTVANWENGSHAPRHAALTKIAHALQSSPASLLEAPAAGAALAQHHVPIINAPQIPGDIDSGAVIGYMTASCDAARPFAFAAGKDYPHLSVARGDMLIFDRMTGMMQDGVYLSLEDAGVSLERSGAQKDAPNLARLVMSISKF